MDNPGTKNVYESGITTLNFIKLLTITDFFVVLLMAVFNSRLFDIINSTLFWSGVIAFFVYREHFRSKIKSLTGLQDWESIKAIFSQSEIRPDVSDMQ